MAKVLVTMKFSFQSYSEQTKWNFAKPLFLGIFLHLIDKFLLKMLATAYKSQLKWIKDLNVRTQIIKQLYIVLYKKKFRFDPKCTSNKSKSWLCTAQENRVKRQSIGENIYNLFI
jgi:hypothetical protein